MYQSQTAGDGRSGVPVLEDKVVQRATVAGLNQIYEPEFVGFSYGFRPGRGQHDAVAALDTAIAAKKVNYVLDADMRGVFDAISHEWTVKFVEHKLGDKRVVRLIQKWLKAGVLEDGMGHGRREKKGRRTGEVLRLCWPTSISTTYSTCGYNNGERSGRTAM
jgi:retron-type reverse transcriptase